MGVSALGIRDMTRAYDGPQALYGEVIAKSLQKSYRGISGRQAAQLERWMIYQRSAFIIQRAYREHIEWKEIITYTNLRRVQKSMNFERVSVTKKGKQQHGAEGEQHGMDSPSRQLSLDGDKKHRVPQSVGHPTSLNFRKCLRNRAEFDEKMSVWRAIIELRRGHFGRDTHICMKAMLEANGDVSRAMILMGDPTYHLKNEGPVPLHLQQMFMPFLRDEEYMILSKKQSSPSKKMTGAGFRSLQTLRAASMAAADDDDEGGGLDLSPVVLDAYFTQFFVGRRDDSVAPCQKPQSVPEIPSVKPLPVQPRFKTRKSTTKADILASASATLKDAAGKMEGRGRSGVYDSGSRGASPISRKSRASPRRPSSAGVRASKENLIHSRMASAAAVAAQRAQRAAGIAESASNAALGVTGRFGEYKKEFSEKRRRGKRSKFHAIDNTPQGLYPYDEAERETGDAELLQTLLSIQQSLDNVVDMDSRD